MSWLSWVEGQLDEVRATGRWREVRTYDAVTGGVAAGVSPELTLPDGRRVVSFASNDYLGLSQHPMVIAAACAALQRWGSGSAASRLIVGSRPIHDELEGELSSWRATAAALVYNSGYAANLGVLSTFGAGARIVSDALNHASIVDGARLARAEVCVYGHGDVEHAADLVRSAPGRALVVSDTVFSMDGDVAPVAELGSLCARSGALLVLDDAHAVLDVPVPDPDAACLRVGTMSKTLGALGGFVAGPRVYIDLLVNRSRSFIFTTGLSPADAAAALAAVRICRSAEGGDLRVRLRANVDAARPDHPSPIVPIVFGAEAAALEASAALLERGFLVPAVRPPTVPVGASRLRVALSALHTTAQVQGLLSALNVFSA